MNGRIACWVPGLDHAGIGTQSVVEKTLMKQGIDKRDLGREKFLEKVWEWKEKYNFSRKNLIFIDMVTVF
jgi:valyl-tRNA synthetase